VLRGLIDPAERDTCINESIIVNFVVRSTAATVVAASSLLVAGCVHVKANTVVRDRFDYGQSLAESWKQQVLLNVVRIRYADAPIFVDVTNIINSYTKSASATAGATVSADNPQGTLSANGVFSNTPTVTYQPLTGDKFIKSMLQPIPVVAIFQMLQAGWPGDLLLRTAVRSINDLQNQRLGHSADPQFNQVISLVTRLQESSALNIRVEKRKPPSLPVEQEEEVVILALSRQNFSPSVLADVAEFRRLLGITDDAKEYTVVGGTTARSSGEIAVSTRSMFEVIIEYGSGIDVSASDKAEGRVLPFSDSGDPSSRLVHISTGLSRPGDAYAAIPYRGRWFWIYDRDLQSKARFTLLMILSWLVETAPDRTAPVLTVPTR